MHADGDAAAVRPDPARRLVDGTVGTRRTPRARPVIAQVGRGGGRCQAAGTGRGKKAAAGRQTDIGVGRVLSRVTEPVELVECDPVGDGHAGGERSNGEVGSRRLEHEGLRRVGNEKGGVIGLLVRGVGNATLPARLEEPGQHVDGLGCGAGPLEPEAHQVHADEGRLGRGGVVGRGDTLVSDGHAEFVDAVLGPPQPGGTREKGGMRPGVPDGEVLRTQRAPRRGAAAEGPGDLDLARRPVGILGEDHAAWTGGAQRVAHGRSVGRVGRVAVRGTAPCPHGRPDRPVRHCILGSTLGRAGGCLPDAPA